MMSGPMGPVPILPAQTSLPNWIATSPSVDAFFGVRLGMMAQGRRFLEVKPVGLRVIAEQLRVAAPIQRRIDLALRFFLREMLVENVPEKFERERVVRLPLQRVADLLNHRDVLENRFAKTFFPGCDVGFRKLLSRWCDVHVSLRGLCKAQQHRLIYDRKQVVYLHE